MSLPYISAAAFGARIASAREELGLTQEELASKVGLDRDTIAEIELGRRNASAHEVERLAAVLGGMLGWLTTVVRPAG